MVICVYGYFLKNNTKILVSHTKKLLTYWGQFTAHDGDFYITFGSPVYDCTVVR